MGALLHHKTTRKELIDAATMMLAEESFSQFSMERVATRAGVSRRTLFNHFRNRDEFLTEVLKQLRDSHDMAMHEWSADIPDDLPVETRIRIIFERILEIISHPTWRGSAFIRLSSELADLEGHPIHQIIADAKRDQEKWFERELSRGNYASPSIIAEQLAIVLTGLFQLQLIHRSRRHGLAVLKMLPVLLAAGLPGVA